MSNLRFLEQRGKNDDVFLTGIGGCHVSVVRNHANEIFEREFSVLVFVLVEILNDVSEQRDLAGKDQTAVTSESELFFGLFEEALEESKVEEARGDGEASAFGAHVHEDEAGGRASHGGGLVGGAAAEADVLPARHKLFETHDLTNLVDFHIHRTRHCTCTPMREREREGEASALVSELLERVLKTKKEKEIK